MMNPNDDFAALDSAPLLDSEDFAFLAADDFDAECVEFTDAENDADDGESFDLESFLR